MLGGMENRVGMVTGATGYLGALVVERLLELGWGVRVLVRDAGKLDPGLAHRVEVVEGDAAPGVLSRVGARGRALWERGLTTVEYAIGIVLVLTIVGLLIKAASEGWFSSLVKNLVGVIFRVITAQIGG